MGLNAIAIRRHDRVCLRHFHERAGEIAQPVLGWNYHFALFVCSGVVLVYVLKGGLTSAIYTEVLQFFMIVLGFAPVVYLALKDVGGWSAMTDKLHAVAQNPMALDLNTKSVRAGRLDQRVETAAGRTGQQPDGRGCVRHCLRPRLCAVVRLLVHQLPRRPARHGGKKHDRRAQHAASLPPFRKCFFPLLVILPGMLAVALTAMPDKDYRIPPPIIAAEYYAKAVDVIKNTNPADVAAGNQIRWRRARTKSECGQNHRAHHRQCRDETFRR